MTLPDGARLGPFQIQAPLGAGGMGEVYRARDTRLGREVALKTLPPGAASDPDRRARFEQEARAASSLNHPNIITILEIGDADGTSYIAMEYLEGRTLRELLAAGPLATRKLLEIAAQIAEGLAKAHAAGIVHRDLKPDNVIVSRDGFVKILDFGLAKLVQMTPETISELETVAKGSTLPGTLLGTVGYMSPEQARGEAVDFRSDQFSLGTILYEMATGRHPFHGKTKAETLVAIIREEPEQVGQTNPRAPAPLRWILERCLAKDPDERYASTRDLARDLAGIRDHLSEAAVSAQALAAPRRRWLARTALAGAGLVAGIALGLLLARGTATAPAERNFTPLTFRRGTVPSARFAPDGQTVVYAAAWEGNPVEIYSVRFDGPESRSLGLPPANLLSVSASGEMAISLRRRFVLGWESAGTLARAPLGGGAPRELLDNVQEADWAPDGSGLAIVRDAGERRRLEFPVGRVLHETAGWISHARVSPDGKWIAFVDHPTRGDNVGAVTIVDMQGARRMLSPAGATGLAWSPGGDEVWISGGFALDLEGRARRIWQMPGTALLHDVSRDGRVLLSRATWRREMVGRAPGAERESNLSWLDWSYPSDLSDDGATLLFDEQNRTLNASYLIYLRKTDGSPAVRLGRGRSMGLSPDGRWVLVSQVADAALDLVLLPTGAGDSKTFPRSGITYESGAWFPDGRRVVVSGSEPGRGSRLYVVEVPDGRPEAVSPEGVTLYHWKAVSPDGRAVVAVSPDGTLWLYPIGGGEPRPVPGATREDVPIRWTEDGRALYVQSGSDRPTLVEILDVTTGERRPWLRLTPPDPAGILVVGPIRLGADGKAYVYSYRRILDELFVADGVR